MQDLRKIFRYARPYRRDLFAAVGLIFIECIFEMVIPVLMSTLVDDGVPTHNMAVIFRQGGLMILCAVLALITGLLYARYAARFANGFAAELRMAEYAAVQKFDFANLDRFSDASLVTRMTTDVTVMLNAVNAGLRPLVRSPVMLCMGLAMACVLSPRLTIVFLVTTPILAAVLAWIVTKVGPLYGRQQSAVDHLNGRIQESLTAIRAIKAFVRGDYENAQFDTVNTELSDASTETFRYAVLNLPAFQTVMYTAIVCILWFGGNYILVGTMSVGQLTAFLSYVLQVLNSVMMFSGVFLQMSRSLASARRIREVLTETPDLANAAAPVDTIPDGQIDFDHVSLKCPLRHHAPHPGRCDGGHHRRHGRGQNDARPAHSAPVRRHRGHGPGRRARRPRLRRERPAGRRRHRAAKEPAVLRHDPRQPEMGRSRRDGRRPLGRLPRRPCGRIFVPDARWP